MINDGEELKERVTAKEREIQAEISRLRPDCSRLAQEKVSELESRLSQIRAIVHNDWEQVTEAGAASLREWLRRS